MSKTVMKLALEALETGGWNKTTAAITALREALAEQKSGIKQVIELYDSPDQPAQQKPVAAECKFDREQKWVRCEIAHHNLVQSEPHKWPEYQTRLLYTSPPPQRTWVGLTDEERMDVLLALNWDKQLTHMDTAKAIEAKLKEKNT